MSFKNKGHYFSWNKQQLFAILEKKNCLPLP